MFRSVFPILSTADLEALVAFYSAALDGEEMYRFPDEGEPAYVALRVAGSELGIARDPDAPGPDASQRQSLWVYADDCDAATARLADAGATVITPPEDMPWGERVADLADPDGNRLHVARQPD